MQKFIAELANDNISLANILIHNQVNNSEHQTSIDDYSLRKSLEFKTKEISTLISKCDKLMKTVD